MIVVKKYSNRRLYDTRRSGYITLEELADVIRGGDDVRVVDAKTGDDLTQATLTQIILDSRGAAKLLPVELLTQMIRMGDEALAEFLGKYMTWALESYLAARRGAQAVQPYFPFATLPFAATNAMARMLTGQMPWGSSRDDEPRAPPRAGDELADLRREIEELKRTVGDKKG
jgi:polyhydroxyalkanoate synthesis repressor PhaR